MNNRKRALKSPRQAENPVTGPAIPELQECGRLLDALRESEVRSQLAIEGSGDGVWDWNVQTNEAYFSPQWKQILGFSDDELSSSVNEWASRVHPDDIRFVTTELQRHMAGETASYSTEHRVQCKNGTYKWILGRGRIISRTADGKPLRMVGTHTDVTGRRQMENALKESRQRYMAVFDKSPIAIMYYDADGRLEMLNEACTTMFGLIDSGAIKGLCLFDDPNITQETKARLRQGQVVRSEFDFSFDLVRRSNFYPTTKRGIRRIDSVIAPLVDTGHIIGYVAQAQDITEQKRTERAFKQSEANFATFFNSVDSFLMVIDMSGDIIMMNDAVCERLGYTRDELVGTPVVRLHPESKRREAEQRLHEVLQGRADSCPLPFVTSDGREIPCETHVTRGRWNRQEVLFCVGKDISALTFSEEKFSKMFHGNTAVMMLSTLHDSRLIDVNEAFLTGFGYGTREEVVGKTLEELAFFTNPADRQTLRAQALNEGRMGPCEARVLTRQGETRYGLVSGEVLDVQNTKYLITTAIDITYRKQIEEALRQEREFSNSAIDSLPGIFYLLDLDGRLRRWNKNAETISGYAAAGIAGMHCTHFFTREHKSIVAESVRKTFAQGHDAIEADIVAKNGTRTPYFFSGRRITLNGKRYVIGLGMDISNLKDLEQELRVHQDQLEQKIAERTQELETNREELETKTRTLEEVNTALKVLLRQIGEDKKDLEARFVSNIKQLVLPYVEKVKRGRLDHWQQSCLSIIETNLNEIVSPLTQALGQLGLTPRETQIAALIKEGKTTKEIAEIIGVAPSAIDTNRNRIRHKLKLNNKKVNLQAYLQGINGGPALAATPPTPSQKG